MSFYRYFDNKTDLAKRVLDNVISDGSSKIRRIILTDDDTAFQIKCTGLLILRWRGQTISVRS
ncbi:hypothetical protein MASR1M46_16020 [Bacteroidales bacterium]